jgi:hypothetical protein
MKRRSFGYGGLLLACLALGSCSNSAVSLAPGGNAAVPRFVRGPVHPDRRSSWMSLGAKSSKLLLYVGDDETDDVYAYDYKSGKSVGMLTGFSGPYGMCVGATGDIYISTFDDEDVVEYAHGGTKVLNTYVQSGGTPVDCAVDAKDDVAVTGFDPGEVTVFAKGDPSNSTTYSDPSCPYLRSMAYDLKGDLVGIGEGENGPPLVVCGLLAGMGSTSRSPIRRPARARPRSSRRAAPVRRSRLTGNRFWDARVGTPT